MDSPLCLILITLHSNAIENVHLSSNSCREAGAAAERAEDVRLSDLCAFCGIVPLTRPLKGRRMGHVSFNSLDQQGPATTLLAIYIDAI